MNVYLYNFDFYNDIINIPNNLQYKTDDLCSICLDNCINPITTNCNHIFCLKCLIKTNKFFDFCPNCKTKTIIDPVYIILNNILKCDIKYSPFCNKKNSYSFDIVSDLHIDQWSTDYNNPYPCGPIINKPFEFNNINSEYLIIAGDISDSIDDSVNFLNTISKHYKKILFVDGNHEHVNKYPLLYDTKYIQTLINNQNIHYLSNSPYIINNTAFIGCCGWWDYDNSNHQTIKENHNYFNNWINHFTIDDSIEFINNVTLKANKEYEYLDYNIEKLNQDTNINNIIIVTHTLPNINLCNELSNLDTGTHLNTKLDKLLKYNKITHWIFGHTHETYNKKVNNIQFICNPRGRPEDFNRLIYNQISITL